jgi:hypothetical protein
MLTLTFEIEKQSNIELDEIVADTKPIHATYGIFGLLILD